jgi:hypothetical protein
MAIILENQAPALYGAGTVKYLRTREATHGAAAMLPGGILRGKRRAEYLQDLGAVVHPDGEGFSFPSGEGIPRRHVASLSARKRHGESMSDQEACGATSSLCPALSDAGISATEAYLLRVPNTPERRAASIPCTACLVALWRRDATGEAPEAGAYDAATHRVRDARGALRGA